MFSQKGKALTSGEGFGEAPCRTSEISAFGKGNIEMTENIQLLLAELTPCSDPYRKDTFLRMYRRRTGPAKTGIREMLMSQFTYISAPVWITTLSVLFLAVWGSCTNRNVITGITALMPFVSGFAVFESFRSLMHGMTEIEGTTLFSLRGVFFAKSVCIGSVHILLILLISLLLSPICQYNFFTTGMLITIPCLISSILSMKVEKTPFGSRNPLVCLGISALTSGSILALSRERIYFTGDHKKILYSLFMVLIVLFLFEIKKTFQWEEYLWK